MMKKYIIAGCSILAAFFVVRHAVHSLKRFHEEASVEDLFI
jgi:hypothetical protein